MVEFTAGTTERTGTESPTANVPYLDFPGDLIFQLAASYVPENNEGKLHYEITGGADAGLFTIVNDVLGEENWANLILHGENWSGGRVDYETNLAFGGGTYAVNVTVTSTLNGAQSTGAFSITVLDYSIVSWTTFFISGGGNPLAVTNVINGSIEEGAANGTELFDVEATDGSGSPVYSLSADSSNGAFEIDANTGVVSVKDGSLINYENNGPYTITVKATENANDFVTRDFTISVTDVAPSTPVDDDAADNEVAENTADVTVGVMAFATDVAGGDVRYSVTDSRFVIDEVTGIVKVAPDGFPLGLDFEATPSIDLEVTASTVNGGLVSKQTFTINVLDANDAPVMFEQTLFADENQTSAGTPTVTDQDNDTLTYELTGGGADASLFTIDENTGALSFKAAQDFEAPGDFDADGTYAVEVKVDDGNGDSVTETVFVQLANKNEAPQIDKVAFNSSENIAGAADVFAADPDSGDSIEYTITGGADQALFTIGAGNGFLDFLSAPDFENKIDADTDGVYEVEVTATDEGGLSDTQLVKITVKNENDAPVITSTTLNADENDKVVGALTVTDQDPGDTAFKNFFVTGGADGALFDVDIQTGVLSFVTAPDFENKIDADTDGVYEVEVTVSDQSGTPGKQTILVTVTDELIEPGVTITGTAGVDTIDLTKTVKGQPLPTGNLDTIFGLGGNDVIDGAGGDDKIFGGIGKDILFGNSGADELDGDADADTVTYVNSGMGVTIALDGVAGTGGDAAGDTLIEIENLTGSSQADRLTGNSLANKITGGAGDDTISGGNGRDILEGGAGVDTVDFSNLTFGMNLTLALGKPDKNGDAARTTVAVKLGSVTLDTDSITGFENVRSGDGNDTLTGNSAANILDSGTGDDFLTGGAGADTLDGGSGFDKISYAASAEGVTVDLNKQGTYVGGDPALGRIFNAVAQTGGDAAGDLLWGIENVVGSAKNDLLTAINATELIDGGAGDDVIVAGDGEVLLGGAGMMDTLSFVADVGGIDADLTRQGTANSTRTGLTPATSVEIAENYRAAEFENLIGGSGGDDLVGNAKANVIDGGAGNDQLNGGAGIDTVSFASLAAGVIFGLGTLNTKTGAVAATGATSGLDVDSVQNFENIIGTAHVDDLSGNAGANIIDGGADADKLKGFAGNDTLRGGAGEDEFDAGGILGAGADVLDGGADFDKVSYNADTAGLTVVLGNNGASATVTGGTGSSAKGDKLIGVEWVVGSSGIDKLTGNNVAHRLDGGGGNDALAGGTGSSMLNGETGDDTIFASVGADENYDGGSGGETNGDTLSFANFKANTPVNVNLASGNGSVAGISSLAVSNFEVLIGGAGNDTLTGNAATATKITGGAGNDTIKGGTVVDTFTGGAGSDTYVFADAAQGKDVFTDFTNGDKLQIDRAGFGIGLSAGALADATYLVAGAGAVATNTGGHGQFIYNTTTDILSWDADGDGLTAAVEIGQFGSSVTLKLADFALV